MVVVVAVVVAVAVVVVLRGQGDQLRRNGTGLHKQSIHHDESIAAPTRSPRYVNIDASGRIGTVIGTTVRTRLQDNDAKRRRRRCSGSGSGSGCMICSMICCSSSSSSSGSTNNSTSAAAENGNGGTAARNVSVRVPQWKFIYHQDELEEWLLRSDNGGTTNESTAPLPFPLLVKHFSSYSSIGLTKDSKVWNVTDLRTQCHRMLHEFGGCLIEEFIVGREFTVLVAEVPNDTDETGAGGTTIHAYEPVECRFGPQEDFKHFQLKWVRDDVC